VLNLSQCVQFCFDSVFLYGLSTDCMPAFFHAGLAVHLLLENGLPTSLALSKLKCWRHWFMLGW
jgi:hypothetical protein